MIRDPETGDDTLIKIHSSHMIRYMGRKMDFSDLNSETFDKIGLTPKECFIDCLHLRFSNNHYMSYIESFNWFP